LGCDWLGKKVLSYSNQKGAALFRLQDFGIPPGRIPFPGFKK
jgi:hypothetical protein